MIMDCAVQSAAQHRLSPTDANLQNRRSGNDDAERRYSLEAKFSTCPGRPGDVSDSLFFSRTSAEFGFGFVSHRRPPGGGGCRFNHQARFEWAHARPSLFLVAGFFEGLIVFVNRGRRPVIKDNEIFSTGKFKGGPVVGALNLEVASTPAVGRDKVGDQCARKHAIILVARVAFANMLTPDRDSYDLANLHPDLRFMLHGLAFLLKG